MILRTQTYASIQHCFGHLLQLKAESWSRCKSPDCGISSCLQYFPRSEIPVHEIKGQNSPNNYSCCCKPECKHMFL
uniref:Putative ovule protein n=1 Tax=Solanum chacoense TaxID=4108 RepID=A0A0V0HSY7_SOLCH